MIKATDFRPSTCCARPVAETVMDPSQLPLFRLIGQRLDYLSQRQSVLAQNVANADTPGYQPLDLEPFAEHVARTMPSRRLEMTRTHPGHIDASAGRADLADANTVGDAYESAPSGNEVVLEQQMIAVAQNAMDHQLALNLYRKQAGMIRIAIGRAR